MPGMNSGLNPASPILVSAFRSALLQQWLIIAIIFVLLLIAWGASRTAIFGPSVFSTGAGAPAAGTDAAAGRLRCHLAVRRDPPGAAADGGRPGRSGDPAVRVLLTWLGAARGELRRDRLGLPPRAGRRGVGVDPGRDRALDAPRGARAVRQARRARRGRLGPGGLGVRRVVRRDLRAWPDHLVRRAGGGAHLRGGRGAARASRAGLG